MKRLILASLAASMAFAGPALAAKCADEIKAMQGEAAGSDARSKPGAQTESTTSAAPTQGGGERSASAKVLEAQAHDQRGDEEACMKAIQAAKMETK